MKPVLLALVVFCIVHATAATGADPESKISDAAKARLEGMLAQSGGQLTYFRGPAEMIGVGVTFANGKQMVLYATPDGRTAFSGVAVDVETGRNISARDVKRLPTPTYGALLKAVSATGDAPATTTVSEGNPGSPNRFYVFFDPKCPYCHRTYAAFREVLGSDVDLVVHYIPVGILGPESQNLAKELLGMPSDKASALLGKLVRGEQHLTTSDFVGAGAQAHAENLAVFREFKFDSVPVIVSDVEGDRDVHRGAMSAEVLRRELGLAPADTLAASGP